MSSSPRASRFIYLHGIWGGVVVLVIAGFYAFALPRISTARAEAADIVEPIPVADGLEVSPQPGWVIAGEDPATLEKGGVTMVFLPLAPRADVEAQLREGIESLEFDPDEHWEVGEPVESVTDAGDQVTAFEAHSQGFGRHTWLIVHGESTVVVVGMAGSSVWPFLSPEMEEMVASLEFTEEGG